MALKNATLYDNNISSKKLNKELNIKFERGWSPVLKPVYHGHRVVLQLMQWIGSEGEQPFDPQSNTYYLGANDFVTNIEDAINIADGYISSNYFNKIIDIDNVEIELRDGNFYLRLNSIQNPFTNQPIKNIELNEFLFSNNLDLSPKSINFGATQNAIWHAIENAKSKFNIPIITLNSELITTVETMQGLTPDNPYFAMVGIDARNTGATGSCSMTGYEGMCTPAELNGSICTSERAEVRARWQLQIKQSISEGRRISIEINNILVANYTVQIDDTNYDIINGLVNYVENHTALHGFNATYDNDNLIIIAPQGSGSNANNWNFSYTISPNIMTELMFILITLGISYRPQTCKGVQGHFIGYDGNRWYDFGVTFNNITNITTNINTLPVEVPVIIPQTETFYTDISSVTSPEYSDFIRSKLPEPSQEYANKIYTIEVIHPLSPDTNPPNLYRTTIYQFLCTYSTNWDNYIWPINAINVVSIDSITLS